MAIFQTSSLNICSCGVLCKTSWLLTADILQKYTSWQGLKFYILYVWMFVFVPMGGAGGWQISWNSSHRCLLAPCVFWEPNSGSLEEQNKHWTAELFPQLVNSIFKMLRYHLHSKHEWWEWAPGKPGLRTILFTSVTCLNPVLPKRFISTDSLAPASLPT